MDSGRAETTGRKVPSEAGWYDPEETSRAHAIVRLSLICAIAWMAIICGAAWWLHNVRAAGVAVTGLAMVATWTWVLRRISDGRMTPCVIAVYTVSALVLLLVMGLFVPELSLLFTFVTFMFLAFGLCFLSGRPSMQVVALTLVVALILMLTSVVLHWSSGAPDGSYRWFILVGVLMALSVDSIIFILLRRTLEARAQRLVEAERDAAQMLRRLSQQERLESLGKLAGGVAHDFNNLLGVILNYTAFIAEAAADRPDLLHDLEEVHSAAKRAAALTRQLLIFGRRDLSHGEVVDINCVIRDTERLLRSAVGEHIEFQMRLSAEGHRVRIDTSHLEQVLLNLSVNARDAMPEGGPLLIETSEREFGAEATMPGVLVPGRYVCLSVTDTGTGFTEEARQHVFEPFFTTKPAGRGTGLGLATIYGIAREAGGDIELLSELGVGTTIRVYLPEAGDAVGRAAETPAGFHSRTVGQGRTVLLVEDEPQLRQVTARILEHHNYRLLVAENPHEGLAVLRAEERVELLITDVVMPGMSGLQLAERATAVRPHLRFLFMSGFPRDLWERGEIDRDLPIIEKPFDAEQLLRRVSEVLASEPASAEPATVSESLAPG
jgi:signal transduction histidine kinase